MHLKFAIRVFIPAFLLFTVLIGSVFPASSGTGLVNLKEYSPHIIIDLKYATTDNFLKEKVYTDSNCYVLQVLAKKLDQAQKILEQDGLGLKIYDGFRPLEIQKKMWNMVPDARFVANPNTGASIHNRGAAVDLTLVDSGGNELEMPTPFDTFSERAYQTSGEPTPQQRANRMLLRRLMQSVGIEYIRTEWWHYQLPNGKQYPIIQK